jgi:hypothetical protein
VRFAGAVKTFYEKRHKQGGSEIEMVLRCFFFLRLPPIFACPVCETATGRQVREGILNADFPLHFAGALLPFLVLTAVLAAIHFSAPRVPGRRRIPTTPALDRPGPTPEEPSR